VKAYEVVSIFIIFRIINHPPHFVMMNPFLSGNDLVGGIK